MQKVMVRAWKIAKEAVAKFGGKVKEFFQQALIMAWVEFKKGADKMDKLVIVAKGVSEKQEKLARIYLNEFENDFYSRMNTAIEKDSSKLDMVNGLIAKMNRYFETLSAKEIINLMILTERKSILVHKEIRSKLI